MKAACLEMQHLKHLVCHGPHCVISLDGETPEDRRMGPPSALKKAEETMLATFCINCGFPINREDLLDMYKKLSRKMATKPLLPMEGQATIGFQGLCTLN